MKTGQHLWIVFHRVRFLAPIDGNNNPFSGPKLAESWRFYPALPVNSDGMRTNILEEWGGFGIYSSHRDAEEVFESREDHLSFLGDTVEFLS